MHGIRPCIPPSFLGGYRVVERHGRAHLERTRLSLSHLNHLPSEPPLVNQRFTNPLRVRVARRLAFASRSTLETIASSEGLYYVLHRRGYKGDKGSGHREGWMKGQQK